MTTLLSPRRHRRGNYDRGPIRDNRNGHALARQRRAILVVARALAERAGFTLADLLGHKKPKPLSCIRVLAIAAASEVVGASEPETARAFGRKNHNTVRHAKRVAAALNEEHPNQHAELLAFAHESLKKEARP